jgi:hypothetical protein
MRAVTGDHILFRECIPALRSDTAAGWRTEEDHRKDRIYGYLFLDFYLSTPLVFEDFQIDPAIEVKLPGAYSAFISRVKLPIWVGNHNSHFFTIALSTAVSFAIGRPVKSTRDDYWALGMLDQNTLNTLAIQFPVLTAGPGAHNSRLSSQTMSMLIEEVQRVVKILRKLPTERYILIMQAMRLVQLAHLVHRDDFGLAYYLLISAIECIAQSAISRRNVVEQHPKLLEWKERAKEDAEFKQLFKAYTSEWGKSNYLKKRFVRFLQIYSPPESWGELDDPNSDLFAYLEELHPGKDFSHIGNTRWHEIYPVDLSTIDIERILSQAYTHRSSFTHKGEQPPHDNPNSYNRYFDEVFHWGTCFQRFIVPNYRLMSFLARKSIIEYATQECRDA